tara:strand:+ start:1681 stop:2205 length:525 start_codon:yes stop_codon:yes gene_type:complete
VNHYLLLNEAAILYPAPLCGSFLGLSERKECTLSEVIIAINRLVTSGWMEQRQIGITSEYAWYITSEGKTELERIERNPGIALPSSIARHKDEALTGITTSGKRSKMTRAALNKPATRSHSPRKGGRGDGSSTTRSLRKISGVEDTIDLMAKARGIAEDTGQTIEQVIADMEED